MQQHIILAMLYKWSYEVTCQVMNNADLVWSWQHAAYAGYAV